MTEQQHPIDVDSVWGLVRYWSESNNCWRTALPKDIPQRDIEALSPKDQQEIRRLRTGGGR